MPSKKTAPMRALCDGMLEVRACKNGNGVFATQPLASGWCWFYQPVCVPSSPTSIRRRLPLLIDELMAEIANDEYLSHLLTDSPWRMSYVQRHLDQQGDGPDVMPRWARAIRMRPADYNVLAARLQSNVARHVDGEGLVLWPHLRMTNHACGDSANCEICRVPGSGESGSDLGSYALRAVRQITAGEEIVWSYHGDALSQREELDERRALLFHRWGFWCQCGHCRSQMEE